MAGKGSGVELGTAWYTLTVDGSGVTDDIKRVMGDAGKVAEKEGSVAGKKAGDGFGKKLADATKTAAKGAGLAAGGAVAAGFGTSVAKGFGRLKAIEEAQSKLKGLGNTAEDITTIMENANNAVTGTAYGLGDAASVAASMVASGIKPGKELEQVLTTLADTSAIAGASITDMGLIFGSVAARGKLQGDDMMQMLGRGIPVLQIVAAEVGKTSAEVSKMVSNGEVNFELFARAMENYVGGAAQSMGNTVSGAISNTIAAMGRFGAVWLDPGFKKAPEFFTGVTKGINEITKLSKPAAAELQRLIDSLDFDPNFAINAVDDLVQAFERVQQTAGFQHGMESAREALSNLAEAGKIVIPVLENLGTIAAKIGGTALLSFTEGVRVLSEAFLAISPAIELFTDAIAALPAPLLAVSMGYLKFADTINGPVKKSFSGAIEHTKDLGKASMGAAKWGKDLGKAYGVAGGQIGAMSKQQAEAAASMSKIKAGVAGITGAVKGLAKTTVILAGVGIAIDGVMQAFQLNRDLEGWETYITQGSHEARERVDELGVSLIGLSRGSEDFERAMKNHVGSALDEMHTRAEETKNLWANVDQWINKNIFGGSDYDYETTRMQKWAEDTSKGIETLRSQFSDLEIGRIVSGSDEFYNAAIRQLKGLGDEGDLAAKALARMKAEYDQANAGSDGYREIRQAIKVLGDEAASTEEKVKALDRVVFKPQDDEKNPAKALAAFSAELDTLSAKVQDIGGEGGFMSILMGDGVSVDSGNAEADKFFKTVDDLKFSLEELAIKTQDQEKVTAQFERSVQAMADAAGIGYDEMYNIIATNTVLTREKVNELVAEYGKASDAFADFRDKFQQWDGDFGNGDTFKVSMDFDLNQEALAERLNEAHEGIDAYWDENAFALQVEVDSEEARVEAERVINTVQDEINNAPAATIRSDLEDGEFTRKYEGLKYQVAKIDNSTFTINAEGKNFESTSEVIDFLIAQGLRLDETDPEIDVDINGDKVTIKNLEDVIMTQSNVDREIPIYVPTPDAVDANNRLQTVGDTARQVPFDATITTQVNGAETSMGLLDGVLDRLGRLAQQVSVIDTVRSAASNAMGLFGRAGGGTIPKLASGGSVMSALYGMTLPSHGAWGSAVDNIIGWNVHSNRPAVLLNGDEEVISAMRSREYRKALKMINVDHPAVRHLKRLASGGTVNDAGSSASAYPMLDRVYTTAGTNETMRAFQSSVRAFGDVVARYEQQEIRAERFERERQEKVKRETERLNEARQREQDRLSDRFDNDRKSEAYQAQKKAIDKRYDDLITRLDPPDPRTAAEKRRDEEKAAAKREADIQRAVSAAIEKAGVTGRAAEEIFSGVMQVDEKSARNFHETRQMDNNIRKSMEATREAVIEAIKESSSGIALAIDQAVSGWNSELSKLGSSSMQSVLGGSAAYVDRVTGSMAAVTDAMVQRAMTGGISAIMPAMLGGDSGMALKQLRTTGGGLESWRMYADISRSSARGLQDLARTEEGLAEMARLILTGGATPATMREVSKRFGLADPGLVIGNSFIEATEAYVMELRDAIAKELSKTPPSEDVVNRLIASVSEWTVDFEQDTMEKLRKDLESSYQEAREQIARGALVGDVSAIADDLGAGMSQWVRGINDDLMSTMAEVRKGNRRNSFIEEAPEAYAEHLEMVQAGFAELLETGRVGVNLITGLQLSESEIREYQQWGHEAQAYIARSMGGRAQQMAQEIAEGISDKTSSEWQKLIDDIASGFVKGIMTPVDELVGLLGVEAPKLLTHGGLMEELKSQDNWTAVSRQMALAGAEAVRSTANSAATASAPTFHIYGVTDPKAVADAVDRRLANPGGRAGALLRR